MGIAIAGILAAMVCNLGFFRGLLGFGLSCAFFAAGVICQTCFYNNARLSFEDGDDYDEKIKAHNSKVFRKLLRIYVLNGLVLAFCLPIGVFTRGTYGLTLSSWLLLGAIAVLVALLVGYIVYHLVLKSEFVRRGMMSVTDGEAQVMTVRKKTLKKCLIVFFSVVAVMLVAVIVISQVGHKLFLERHTISSPEDFVRFMQSEYDRWFDEGYGPDADVLYRDEYEAYKSYFTLYDYINQVEYEFYYPEPMYDMRDVKFDPESGQVSFVTRYAEYEAGQKIVIAYALPVGVMALIALIGTSQKRRRRQNG